MKNTFNALVNNQIHLKYFIIPVLILYSLTTYGQITDPPDPCDDGTQETCQCETAPILCTIDDLDGFEYSMSTFQHPQNGPDPLCIGVPSVPNNPTWFAFIAWCEELTLNVEISNCTNVCSGTNGSPCQFPCNLFGCTEGIQIAIYGDCNFTEQVGCNVNDCGNQNDKLLDLQGLEIGKVYYFMVDGCAGSSCDVRINVVGQCGNAEIEPWTNPLVGPDSVCVGTSGFFEADNLSAATLYHWYVNGSEIGISLEPIFEIEFPFEGTFEICVDASNDPCIPVEEPPAQNCTTVEVYFPVEYLGEFIVCQENLPFELGGNFFTQAGLNEFIVTDPLGCEILNQFDLEIIINEPFDADTVLCKEDFPFFFAKTSETISGPGTVFVPATDAFGCDSSYFVNFYQIDFFVQFEVPEDTLRCPNQIIVIGATSSAVFIDNGFNSPVDQTNFQWFYNGDALQGQTAPTIEAGTAGEYTLVISGILGNLVCSDTISIELFEDFSPPPAPILGLTEDVCVGVDFEVEITNYDLQYGINWTVSDNGLSLEESGTTIIISALDTGIMEICAEFFLLDCPELRTDSCFTILITDIFTIEFDGFTGFCPGESTIISLDSNFNSFFWNGVEGEYFLELFESDSLEIIVFDSLGCRGELNIIIEEFPSPNPIILGSPVFCEAGSTTLSVFDEFDLAIWNNSDTALFFTTNEPGLVSVFVIDINGCSATDSLVISLADELEVQIIGNSEICFGEESTFSTVPTFPNYIWSNGDTEFEVTLSEAGVYSVIVDDGQGCFGYDTIQLFVNPLPEGIFNSTEEGLCPESSLFLSFETGFNIIEYQWSTDDSLNEINIDQSGSYTLSVTDINGCTDSFSIEIISFPSPQFEISGPSEFCQGEGTTLAVPDNFAEYLWSNNETSNEIFIATAGLYQITVTDLNGCSNTDSILVEELLLPDPQILGIPSICFGEETTLELDQAYASYIWSTGETSNQITVNETGLYRVTVTAINGCVNHTDFNLTVNNLPIINFTGSTTFCTGFSTNISIQDFPIINWSIGDTSSSININEEGIYTVLVEDINGCQAEASITITEDEELQPVISGEPGFCSGGSTILNAGEGFNTYLWSNGEISSSILADSPGEYSVTVSDADGCSGNSSITVVEYPNPEPEISGDSLVCFGENTILSLIMGYESYSWSNGSNEAAITVNQSGMYSVTVLDSKGCEGEDSFDFVIKDQILPLINGIFEICEGDSALWSVNGDFLSYEWSNNHIGFEIELMKGGIYSVTVTDEDGCTGENSAELIVNPLPIVNAGPDQELNCLVSSVFIGEGINQESGFDYNWVFTETGEIIGTQIIQEITRAGIYELQVVNTVTNCFASDFIQITLDSSDINSLNLLVINPRCFNENSGSIIIEDVDGGTMPYSYILNNVSSSQAEFSNLGAGVFELSLVDAKGCFLDTTITLSYPPEVIVDLGPDIELVFGESVLIIGDVSIEMARIENIVWTINGHELCNPCHDIKILYDLPTSGVVELLVEDFKGCSDMDLINIFVRINRDIYIPNAFSPNSDGINDIFTVYGKEVIEEIEEIMVFNRWGTKVFERRNIPANNEAFGWDGTFNGKKLNPAVFAYYVRVRFVDGITKGFSGDLILMK